MTKPRIAYVSLSPLAVGGVETHLLQLIEGMSREFDFLILGLVQDPFASQVRELRAEVVSLPPASTVDVGMVQRLRGELRKHDVAIVHTHESRAGLLGRVAGRAAGRLTVHTVHTPSFFLVRRKALRWAYQCVERYLDRSVSDAVVFVSPSVRETYARLGLISPRKTFVIPNGLEERWFEPRQESDRGLEVDVGREPRNAKMRFLYVGRLAPEKDLAILMRAFVMLAKDHPRATLQIVGDGPLLGELKGLALEGGVGDRVEFLGIRSREECRGIMRDSDVFVLPSRFESMSYTLLEAMASGLSCIATRVGGNADLIQDGVTGYLVPEGDPPVLLEAMERVTRSPGLRAELGAAARERASQFTVERMVGATRELYSSLLTLGSPRRA